MRKYRAVCTDCHWQGPLRNTKEEAERDAINHMEIHTDHRVEIISS